MEEKVKQKRLHKMHMENRNKLEMTGIVDVISFDLNKVILESDCGMITIKGANLHVSRLSVEKGELDIDGTIESYAYSEVNFYAKRENPCLEGCFDDCKTNLVGGQDIIVGTLFRNGAGIRI